MELVKAKPERLPESHEVWTQPMGAARERSLLLGKGSLGPELWLGLPPGEPVMRGSNPLVASLAEWPKPRETVQPFSCPECGKSFGFPVGLPDLQQSPGGSLGCPGGSLSSPSPPSHPGSNKSLLLLPEAVESSSPPQSTEKIWACPWCQQRFRLRVNLLIHESSHLEATAELGGKDRLACRFCPQRFGRSDHLVRHQMSHTGARPYQCSACEKSFTDKSKLTNHYRTHTGERPFRCSVCGKRFVRRHHLVKHQRTHTRERPHQCLLCPKSFMQKHHLQKHIRTHTGEKPYKCGRCPKAFSCRQRLLKHSCGVPVPEGVDGQAGTSTGTALG